jgi:murein DD-endopeptidase MepM/ murein hydrolase activator NlpD
MKIKLWFQKHFSKKGFTGYFKRYGALTAGLVCAGIVGVVYAVTWNGSQIGTPEPSPTVTTADRQSGSSLDEQLGEILGTGTPAPSSRTTPAPTATAKPISVQTSTSLIPKMLRPVNGTVILEFARDSLVYSETLRQWSTHNGVDIRASEGTNVLAVLDGVVESVVEDEMMGICVTVAHGSTMKSVYCALSQASVTKGQEVKRGDVIGQVGNTATCELASGDHLHFEFHLNGSAVNAAPFFVDE